MNLGGGRREGRPIRKENQKLTGREHRQEQKYAGKSSLEWKEVNLQMQTWERVTVIPVTTNYV